MLITAFLIALNGAHWSLLDPLVTILCSLYMLYGTVGLLREGDRKERVEADDARLGGLVLLDGPQQGRRQPAHGWVGMEEGTGNRRKAAEWRRAGEHGEELDETGLDGDKGEDAREDVRGRIEE